MAVNAYEGVPQLSPSPGQLAGAVNRINLGLINVIVEAEIVAPATTVTVLDERLAPNRAILLPLGSPTPSTVVLIEGGAVLEGAPGLYRLVVVG
jgi:hypothetical protein